MNLEFRNKKLETCYCSEREARKTWGPEVARRYIERVGVLEGVRSLEDLKLFPPLHYHALKGDRQGQHAVRLTGIWRLIFTLTPENAIMIEEVSNHYDD